MSRIALTLSTVVIIFAAGHVAADKSRPKSDSQIVRPPLAEPLLVAFVEEKKKDDKDDKNNQEKKDDKGKDDPKAKEEPGPTGKPVLSRFMRAKLGLAQQALEGLVTEDFAMIESSALKLNVLTKGEEWMVRRDALYNNYSEEFRRVTRQLGKAGKDMNLDGAALAYQQLTMNCIECHRYVRSPSIASTVRP